MMVNCDVYFRLNVERASRGGYTEVRIQVYLRVVYTDSYLANCYVTTIVLFSIR